MMQKMLTLHLKQTTDLFPLGNSRRFYECMKNQSDNQPVCELKMCIRWTLSSFPREKIEVYFGACVCFIPLF